MKRMIAAILFVSLFLIAITGCTLFQRPLEIYPASVAGMVNDDDGGFLVSFSVSGGSGALTVDFDDESDPLEIVGEGILLFDHLYTAKGYYEVSFVRVSDRGGVATGSAAVTVDAPGFELNQPFWTQGYMVGLWEEITFDPFPRIIHCNNLDSYRTGLWPDNGSYYQIPGPYGDMFDPVEMAKDFEMRIYVTTTDGGGGSAYGKNGEVITGEWVPLQTYRVLADWPWARPPYPLEILQKSVCDVDPNNPWIPPIIPDDAGYFLVRQEVQSKHGVYGATQFNIFVGSACVTTVPPGTCE